MIIVSYGLVTCYTAKILAHIILDDLRLKSYSDIGHKAFGPRSGPLINALFCLELFAVGVALVTLFADSLYAVWPAYSPNTYKIFCLVFLIPTVFLPLSVLSYASMLGILSTLLIIVVILIDGFSKRDPPGSLWIPADTSLKFMGIGKLGVSFGLFMAGFSGHAVIPSLARDMVDPSRFDLMINYAFGIATAVYAIIGIAGYLMFGNSVSDEFSQDLAKYSVYPVLNKVALWGLVLTPISKYALSTRPLNITMEIVLGLETNTAPTSEHTAKSTTQGAEPLTAQRRKVVLKRILTAAERAAFTMLSVAVSILVPEFSSMMAFLGACTSFLLCVIGPISAKVALAGRCGFWDGLALVIGTVMAVWGTAATVWSST
ncbi:transmembrane amino acid transporter protein-domain-containing protein [Sparassis latifolia]